MNPKKTANDVNRNYKKFKKKYQQKIENNGTNLIN